jgi:hypothetical protein
LYALGARKRRDDGWRRRSGSEEIAVTDWRVDERRVLEAGGLDADVVELMMEWTALWNEGVSASIADFVAPGITFNDQKLGLDGLERMIDNVPVGLP